MSKKIKLPRNKPRGIKKQLERGKPRGIYHVLEPRMRGSSIKILFIDDEPDACMLFKKILGGKGFNVFTASSAKSGLETYKKEKPYIVFLDIVMPDKDGISLLKKMRDINPKQIIIMITGFGEIRSVRAALKLGAYDYISKPLDIKAVISSIKDALSANA